MMKNISISSRNTFHQTSWTQKPRSHFWGSTSESRCGLGLGFGLSSLWYCLLLSLPITTTRPSPWLSTIQQHTVQPTPSDSPAVSIFTRCTNVLAKEDYKCKKWNPPDTSNIPHPDDKSASKRLLFFVFVFFLVWRGRARSWNGCFSRWIIILPPELRKMAQIWCRTRCTNNKTWNGKNATSSQWIINFKDGFPSFGFQGKSWQLRNGFKASPSPTTPSRSTSSTSGDLHWGWCWGWGEEEVMAQMFTCFGLNLHGKFHMVYACGIYSGIYAKSGNREKKISKSKFSFWESFWASCLIIFSSSASLNESLFHFAPAAALCSAQLQKFWHRQLSRCF